MTESGARLTNHTTSSVHSHSVASTPSSLSVGLCLLTLAACGIALLQIDLPLLRFLRSLNLSSSVQKLGDLGDQIGNGGTLIAVSLTVLGIGWLKGWPKFLRAGTESLLAHVCVALLVTGLKHLIGRPRPRFTHSDEWLWWPSWDLGLDSLPSGHSSTSFAVAAVFAKHFPWTAWPMFGLATLVAMSRVWRGSHFVTDVVAGMATGYIVGTVLAHPLGDWRRSLSCAITNVIPAVVIVTSTIWIIFHRVQDQRSNEVLSIVGIALIVLGLISRWSRLYEWRLGIRNVSHQKITVLIGLGFACATGSFVVIGVTILTVMARWLGNCTVQTDRQDPVKEGSVSKECLYAIGLALLLILTLRLKGIIPIQ
ncbi:MAG: phosphatase PAP2 family protein [Nitrospiraceae bacterium]